MYDGKQVFRFINNYKTKDLYLIGNEMIKRIGTGNYDEDTPHLLAYFLPIVNEVKRKCYFIP